MHLVRLTRSNVADSMNKGRVEVNRYAADEEWRRETLADIYSMHSGCARAGLSMRGAGCVGPA